jgi:hypothetical protein
MKYTSCSWKRLSWVSGSQHASLEVTYMAQCPPVVQEDIAEGREEKIMVQTHFFPPLCSAHCAEEQMEVRK